MKFHGVTLLKGMLISITSNMTKVENLKTMIGKNKNRSGLIIFTRNKC